MAKKEYIERGEVIKEIESLSVTVTGLRAGKNLLTRYAKHYKDSVVKVLSDTPAADVVEVVHARWDEDRYPFCNVCPECGLVIDRTCIKNNSGMLNYCPNCSAKMDEENPDG